MCGKQSINRTPTMRALHACMGRAAALVFFIAGAGIAGAAPHAAGVSPKFHQDLRGLVEKIRTSQPTKAYGAAHRLKIIQGKKSAVFVEFFVRDPSLLTPAYLSRFGITSDTYYGRFRNRVQALVPLKYLETLAEDSNVNWIQPPARPHSVVTSQGVDSTYANTFQNHTPAYTGSGVKVAIIDLGFQNYTNYLGTGLPSSVTAKSFTPNSDITGGGEVHGTACAEIVYEMAPGAQLYLINFSTVAELSAAVTYCIQQGVQVITHSIAWTNQSFYDGTGDVAAIVDTAVAHGIFWCNAAGNEALGHWDGTFSSPDGSGYEDFDGVTDQSIDIDLTANSACELDLTWPMAHRFLQLLHLSVQRQRQRHCQIDRRQRYEYSKRLAAADSRNRLYPFRFRTISYKNKKTKRCGGKTRAF